MSGFVLPTAPDYAGALLLAKDVTMRFGGVTAVSDLSLALPAHAIAGIIGPNGAGKTTVFNVLSGFYTPQEGEITFDGASIRGQDPYRICRLGMARTFQNIRLSPQMTVLENIMVGCHVRRHCPWWMAPLGLPGFYREEADLRAKGRKLAERVHLADQLDEMAGSLPYGAQRRLEIARALATEPRLLLLDEPSLGLAPLLVRSIFETVRAINQRGVTVLLVEQNARAALKLAARGYVLEVGKVVKEDKAQNLLADAAVREAYLGG